jgi:uncharacterized membrane protein
MTKILTPIIRFLNVILAALLAGVSFGIWIGFNPMNLSAEGYLEQQQNMLLALRVLMISLVISATIITIISAILQKNNKSVFITLLIAALFFIACIIITRFGNKPIDDTLIAWTKDSLPDNWTVLRNKWWSFHVMRSIAELVALFLVTLASIKRD